MKMLELMAGLGLWPVEAAEGRPNGDRRDGQHAIVVPEDLVMPEDLRPVMLHPARWPETQRRFH